MHLTIATITPIIIAGINRIVNNPIPKGISMTKTTKPTIAPRIVNNIFKNTTPAVRAAPINIKKTTIPINSSIFILLSLLFNHILHIHNLNVLNSKLEID